MTRPEVAANMREGFDVTRATQYKPCTFGGGEMGFGGGDAALGGGDLTFAGGGRLTFGGGGERLAWTHSITLSNL